MGVIDIDENKDEGRQVGVLAYLWVPGWIIGLVLNGQKRSHLGSFHLRQALGIMVICLILVWVIRLKWIVLLLQAGMSIFGIISAMNYEKNEIPFFGRLFQDWFKTL